VKKEYVVTYSVELRDLSNSSKEVVKLEFTDRQCKEWFRLKEEKQVPVFFVNNLNMFHEKIVLPIYKKVAPSELSSYEAKGIAFYYIKGLELIRRYILNRKFNRRLQAVQGGKDQTRPAHQGVQRNQHR
jgi:hypothetical protein